MKWNRHTMDQIITKSRGADVEIGKGKKVPEICRLLEITEQTNSLARRRNRKGVSSIIAAT